MRRITAAIEPRWLEAAQAEAADAVHADAHVELAGVVELFELLWASAARSAAGAVGCGVSGWSDSCSIWPLILIRIGVLADR